MVLPTSLGRFPSRLLAGADGVPPSAGSARAQSQDITSSVVERLSTVVVVVATVDVCVCVCLFVCACLCACLCAFLLFRSFFHSIMQR